jgi:hypothetical protein
VGEAGSETAIGLTGPQAGEVLERVGLPDDRSAMAGTSVEWNGWNLRILRGYGVLAQHYEFWLPTAGWPSSVVVPAHGRSDAGGLRIA